MKLAVLIAYIVALFFADTWAGIGLFALMGALVFAVSRLPLGSVLRLLSPAFLLAAMLVVFNAFVLAFAAGSLDAESSSSLMRIAGPVYLSLAGLESGLFFAARVVLLVLSSLVVGLTTTSTELSSVATWALAPL
ncbi:MAG: energy-coupling factor transporter transmembrane protein EcfT, partial [Eggerthellaceae bacterium]|nr:energy-coupling factor transporter transmembrane protein EcfT [Eggerthellaceae bacterium]